MLYGENKAFTSFVDALDSVGIAIGEVSCHGPLHTYRIEGRNGTDPRTHTMIVHDLGNDTFETYYPGDVPKSDPSGPMPTVADEAKWLAQR